MFPPGRIFLNCLQLREAVSEFFKHWNLLSNSNSKNIRCSYSFTPVTKKTVIDNNEVSTSKRQSTDSIVKCPFELRWSLVNHKSHIDMIFSIKLKYLLFHLLNIHV